MQHPDKTTSTVEYFGPEKDAKITLPDGKTGTLQNGSDGQIVVHSDGSITRLQDVGFVPLTEKVPLVVSVMAAVLPVNRRVLAVKPAPAVPLTVGA